MALLEAMAVSDRIRNLVARNAPSAKTKKAAVEEGMLTLRRCGIGEAMAGRTSLEEVLGGRRGTASLDSSPRQGRGEEST